MHIKRYLQLAQLNGRLNDAAIMSQLHMGPRELAAFRSGAALPGEELTIIIGEMAGAPRELMLRELATWRDRLERKRRRLWLHTRTPAISPAGDD